MSAEFDRLLLNMSQKEEPIPKGFATPSDFAIRWGKSTDRACDVLRRASLNGLAERLQVARRCGGKTVKIWVYRITS